MKHVDKLSTDPVWISGNWTAEDYKGNALEAFVEILITYSPIDKRINISDYHPHNNKVDGNDMGIDGYGISFNGNLHTIQVKYRANTQRNLTANEDHISNFVAKTTSSPKYQNADMTIFTTAKDLNQKINEEMYHHRVRVLGFTELSKLVDKNYPFWRFFKAEMGV